MNTLLAARNWPTAVRAGLLALTLGLGIAACGEKKPVEVGEKPIANCDRNGESPLIYHRGNFAEPTSMDPHRIAGTWESNIARDQFLGLMTDSAESDAIYGAAESSSVSDDGLTWTFTIREGHVWSDGTPVTAHDFVFSYQRIMNPLTAAEYASILYPIKNAQPINAGEMPVDSLGVRAVDDRTLEIQVEYPTPFLPQMLTHQALYPVPKHAIEQHGDDWIRPENFVSNGAYKMTEWQPNNFVRLDKNELFYDAENVAIDTIYFYPTDNSPAAVTRFENGELDTNNDFPVQQIERLQREFPHQTRAYSYLLTTYTIFNTTAEPFTNKNLRVAMAMALDRETIAEKIMKTGQEPAYALVPPGIVNYPHTAKFEWAEMSLEERIAAAQDLMKAEGYGPDNPLRITYRHREGADNRRTAVAMAAMWKQIYVEAELMNTETKTHYADLRSGNFQIADAGWVSDFNDPKNFLFLLESNTGQLNYGNYANPEYDTLLGTADNTVDIEERGKILSDAEQVMLNDAPLIPVLFGTSRNLVHNYMCGFEDNADDRHPTRWMSIDTVMRSEYK